MLEGDARRALEEEAIALVNLSTGHQTKKRVASAMTEPTTQQQPQERGSLPDIHPLLQQKKAALMARRDDCSAPHPHRVKQALREKDRDAGRCLSMSVFVSADGKMSVIPGGKSSPDNHADFEMRMPKQVSGDVEVMAVKHEGPIPTDYTDSTSPTAGASVADSHISMQSLLVTLKKRKADETSESMQPSAIKLPRFRDVFDAPRYQEMVPPPVSAPVQSERNPVQYSVPSMPSSPSAEPMESSPYPPPPELKCKYRTGKCTNIRALKSCGDYHNLCNYHRLRANANQRKLDRKKKVQRQQPNDGDSIEATSPVKAPTLMPAPTVAAAAALASLPTSFLASHQATTRPASNGTHAMYLPYLVPPSASASSAASSAASSSYPAPTMLRPKPEPHSC